jgi:CBS-domain-containing membrane protein
LIGIIFVVLFKISQDRSIFFLAIGLAVGIAVMLMMALRITHPPAGGNTIVVMLAQDSFQYLMFPIMFGAVTIIIGGIIYNRFILKKNYPIKWF